MNALVSLMVCFVGAFDVVVFEEFFVVVVVLWVAFAVFAEGFFVDVEAVEVAPVDVA